MPSDDNKLKPPAGSAETTNTTQENKNDNAENSCKIKILNLIEKQHGEMLLKRRLIEGYQLKLDEINKRQKLAKKALKKVKEIKLGDEQKKLVRQDLKNLKSEQRKIEEMIVGEQINTEILSNVISLLESIL